MFHKMAIFNGACSLALLACAALPCVGQQVKSGSGSTPGKSSSPMATVNPNPTPVTPPINPFNSLNPYAPSTYRGFGLSNPAFSGRGYSLNGFAANQAATSSIISAVTSSPYINQMQQGFLPGSNIPDPWSMPNPYMSPFMNPMMMTNQTTNNPFMNPMMNNPFMNPMMNPMTVANPFMNPMMMNPMMANPMLMNPGYVSPFMMQPGLFGNMNMPFNQNFGGQQGVFGRGF